MSRSSFALFNLVLACAMALMFIGVSRHFDGREELVAEVSRLQTEKETADLKALLAREETASFSQQVALNLPTGRGLQKNFQARQIASVVTDKTLVQLDPERGAHRFQEATSFFKQKQFKKSNPLFQSLIEDFPDSTFTVRSYFLLVEGLYQIGQYEACADYAERMMTLYPENELTGYSILRLGAVYQIRDRLEDAAQMYQLVAKSYRDPKVIAQAKSLLYEVQE